MTRARFSDDHPIEELRGIARPNPSRVLRAFASRAAYLCKEMAKIAPPGTYHSASGRYGYLVQELQAIGIAVELVEADRTARALRCPATFTAGLAPPLGIPEEGAPCRLPTGHNGDHQP